MSLSNPATLAPILAGLAIALAVCALFWPRASAASVSKTRMNSVMQRRKDLRERRQVKGGDGKLDPARIAAMRQMIERFNMQELLESTELRNKLARAGYRQRTAPVVYVFAGIVLPIALGAFTLVWFLMFSSAVFDPVWHGGIAVGLACVGYILPSLMLKNKADKRLKEMSRAYPDALDLTVICVESGMSMEKAFHRVGDEIAPQSPSLAEEIGLLTAELGYLGDRIQAYENFGARTGVPAISALTSAIVQAERYGTPMGQVLRVLADESRSERMSIAETKAAALPAKLTVPMILFFLPVLFVVIIGPIAISFFV